MSEWSPGLGAQHIELGLDLIEEGDVRIEIVELVGVLSPELESLLEGGPEPLTAGRSVLRSHLAPVAHVRHTIGRIDDHRVAAAPEHPRAERALPLRVAGNLLVLAEIVDQLS